MSTITSLGATDNGSVSRTTINTNFTNLNTDKAESSTLTAHTAATTNIHGVTGSLVGLTMTQTLTNKTLTTPTITTPVIASFASATHSHQNAGGGGTLDGAAIAAGTVAPARLGSGTPGSTTYLRGDGVWGTIATGKFGGTGADGALSITSGTTNIDLGTSKVVVKNYTSISITGTGQLTFTNPHANGTKIILKSQGAVVLTSSATPCIEATGMGAAAGTTAWGLIDDSDHHGVNTSGGAQLANRGFYTTSIEFIYRKGIFIVPGSGGAAGAGGSTDSGGGGAGGFGSAGGAGRSGSVGAGTAASGSYAGGGGAVGGTGSGPGAGGRGGGGLVIECAGDLNFTGTIYTRGAVGGSTTRNAGGGGAGGMGLILYATATSTAGTFSCSGGAGGDSNGQLGGAGGSASGLVISNTEIS